MPCELPATLHPDAVETLPDRFRIEGAVAVRAILCELMSLRVPVMLFRNGDSPDALVSRIVAIDDDAGVPAVELETQGPENLVEAIAAAGELIAVAFPGLIKTQFRLAGATAVALQRPPAAAPSPRGLTLRAPIPGALYRTQRRDAFRVQPPAEDNARCVRRLPPDGEAHYPLVDLSAGGISIRISPSLPVPAPGDLWPHSRLETASGRTIPCDLIVRRIIGEPAGDGGHRVALAFRAPPPESMRAIQVYVIEIERRLRQLTPACS